MIEFKGTYYHDNAPKSVLVQYDGVLLHIWHMADPFCRLMTSDVFQLQSAFGKKKRCIKLPNGNRIETTDIQACLSLDACRRSMRKTIRYYLATHRRCIWLIGGSAFLIGVLMLMLRMIEWG